MIETNLTLVKKYSINRAGLDNLHLFQNHPPQPQRNKKIPYILIIIKRKP